MRVRVDRQIRRRGLVVAAIGSGIAAAALVVPWSMLGRVTAASWSVVFLIGTALGCTLGACLQRVRRPAVDQMERPRPISWWWTIAAAAAVGAAAWITTGLLLAQANQITNNPTERAKARIDAVRTGLATAGGAGAAVALMLAFRRQHHEEASAAATDYDATERRITDLYTKAVEQLGSEKAAVRLGGLYALERLAQNNPKHRQTIVDVICSYLRMPYTPSVDIRRTSRLRVATKGTGGASVSPTRGPERDESGEELQVRLTAQRILAAHLRRSSASDLDTGDSPDAAWEDIDLDLTGSTLIDLDLRHCLIRRGRFRNADFYGTTRFDRATFLGHALFNNAIFRRLAWFEGATFHGAGFGNTIFRKEVGFDDAVFYGVAGFGGASFGSQARFDNATFHGAAGFGRTVFRDTAGFEGATFYGNAVFDKTTFHGIGQFDGVIFHSGTTVLGASAKIASIAEEHFWPAKWIVIMDDSGSIVEPATIAEPPDRFGADAADESQ